MDNPVGRAFALLAVAAFGGALAVARAAGPARAGAPGRPRLARTEWLLPLVSLVALFAAFVAVQIAVLFGGHDHVLRTAGLSYADYAHQGYGQLIAAAMLTLAVIAGASRWARLEGRRDERLLRALLVALCALCLVVLASALKRLGLYEQAYGYTRLRLLADANILWLGAVLALVVAALLAGRAAWLVRAIVIVSAAGAVAFAAANPDGRIAARKRRPLPGGRPDRRLLPVDAERRRRPGAHTPPLPRVRGGRHARGPAGTRRVLGANVARSRARRALAGLPPARITAALTRVRAVRAYYESIWADAPPDPEPWDWERRRALLLGEARAGERVLDLGCGAGRFVAALRDAGAVPVGVEIAESALERARAVAPGADLRLLEPDGSIPLEHGSVDLVWCSEVLEHVADGAHLLQEARRVLRPGGRILVTVPYHGRVKAALLGLVRFDAHFDPQGQHLRFFTRASLAAALEAARFGAPEVSARGGLPLLRVSLTARAPRV